MSSPVHHHLRESLKFENVPTPWPRMVLCSLSVTLPLMIGIARGEQRAAIYGALLGFVLILNDHFGPLSRRVIHLATTFCFLISAFYAGVLLVNSPVLTTLVLFLLAFFVAKSKGLGIELERLLLLTTLQFLAGSQTVELHGHLMLPFGYALYSFVNYLFCLGVVFLIFHHSPNFQASKRKEFVEALRKKDSNRYAYTLAVMTCLGLWGSVLLNIQKGYWAVGTTLIVMMPTRSLSYYRSFQRLLGTLIGVVVAATFIRFMNHPWVLVIAAGFMSFLAPLGLMWNYWLGNVFIAALIMCFLDIAAGGSVTPFDLAYLRFVDIAIGCLFGVIGTLIVWPSLRSHK